MMRGAREDLSITHLEKPDQMEQLERLTRQPKEPVNQNNDIYEWNGNDEQTVF